jgi:hypothetical protein
MATTKKSTPLDFWNEVSKTNPKYTKQVKYGSRSFTTINAQYQLMVATEQFGSFGEGWGIKNETFTMVVEGLLGYQAVLWYKRGTKVCEFDINSSIATHSGSRLDDECFKKVTTDALTKGLSKLGFCSDVFLGMYDDNRYVSQMAKEFSSSNEKASRVLYTLNIGDDNWSNVLKYVAHNKNQGLEKLAQTLGKKYNITKTIWNELDKVIKS